MSVETPRRQRQPSLANTCSSWLFIVAAGISSGTMTWWLATSEPWMKGGIVVDVSRFGHWFLFLSGFLVGGAEAAVLLVVANRYARQSRLKVNVIGVAVIGMALGCITGFSLCLVVSVVFFTFPFPYLWELMTEEHLS